MLPSPAPSPTPEDPRSASVAPEEAAEAEPLDRYKAALRSRFPGPEEIYREADRRRRTHRAGATVAVLAALATGLWIVDPVYRSEAYATAVGETRTHTLADGSTVALNTASALDVQWRLRSRRLHLARGEAMFRVAHGVREFIVRTPGASVRAAGASSLAAVSWQDGWQAASNSPASQAQRGGEAFLCRGVAVTSLPSLRRLDGSPSTSLGGERCLQRFSSRSWAAASGSPP